MRSPQCDSAVARDESSALKRADMGALSPFFSAGRSHPPPRPEALKRASRPFDHRDIAHARVVGCPSDVPRDKAETARGLVGLNTDDLSQTPTLDADRSAKWNRNAKTVKPGSFAAQRMAAED